MSCGKRHRKAVENIDLKKPNQERCGKQPSSPSFFRRVSRNFDLAPTAILS